jgi:hypothetical protein
MQTVQVAEGRVQICAIGALVTYTSLARLGLAEPVDDVPARDIIAMGPYLLALNLMAILGISFAKLSVAFFLLRIVQKEAYRRILFVVIGMLCLPALDSQPPLILLNTAGDQSYHSLGLLLSLC